MNNQSGYFSNVKPFRAIASDANYVIVVPSGVCDTGPKYTVYIGEKILGEPAISAVPPTPQVSGPGLPNYQPATPGKAEIPAKPDTFITHRTEELILTREEWDNWDKSMTDEVYIVGIALSRFKLFAS